MFRVDNEYHINYIKGVDMMRPCYIMCIAVLLSANVSNSMEKTSLQLFKELTENPKPKPVAKRMTPVELHDKFRTDEDFFKAIGVLLSMNLVQEEVMNKKIVDTMTVTNEKLHSFEQKLNESHKVQEEKAEWVADTVTKIEKKQTNVREEWVKGIGILKGRMADLEKKTVTQKDIAQFCTLSDVQNAINENTTFQELFNALDGRIGEIEDNAEKYVSFEDLNTRLQGYEKKGEETPLLPKQKNGKKKKE